jgi:hypothetical protein
MTISIKGTFKYAAITGAVAVAAILPFTAEEHRLPFAVGFVCGVGASMAGFVVMYRTVGSASAAGGKGVIFAGIGLKLFIYMGVMFTMTALFGFWPGIGAAAGCLAMPVATIIRGVAAPKLRRLRGLPREDEYRQYIYEPHMRGADGALRYVFIKGSRMEAASGGRVYKTHRRFRKLAAIRRAIPGERAARV